jgi:predicted acetyltransferase
MISLLIRAGSEADLDRLVEIHSAAYPSDASFERRKRSFIQAGLGEFGAVRVVEREGRIVAHAKLHDLTVWIGGEAVRTGAIGSVAVAPEARGLGVGRWMMSELHAELEARGAALALLYPFREGFYAQLGYATTAPLVSMTVQARAIARAFPRAAYDPLYDVVPIEGPWLLGARELYIEVARRGSGRLARSEARWLRVLASDARHALGVVSRSDRSLQGYVVFTHECPVPHGRQKLIVQELTAAVPSARAALLATLGGQRDQVDDVEIFVPWGDPLVLAFHDAAGDRRGDAELMLPIGKLGAGPMVRIIDARRALEQRGYANDGELTLRCAGQPAPWRVTVRSRRAHVTTLEPDAPCDIELSLPVLASMVASGVRPEQAAQLAWLTGRDSAVRIAEALFAGPRFEVLDTF